MITPDQIEAVAREAAPTRVLRNELAVVRARLATLEIQERCLCDIIRKVRAAHKLGGQDD